MDLLLDRSLKKPLYKQIADQLEQRIVTGELSPDVPLPSERELAKSINVNRSTVVTAYDELQATGLVVRKKGSGTFINTDIWGLAQKRKPNWGRYVEAGTFLPHLPTVQKLLNDSKKNQMINLASGELASDLFPLEEFQSILKTRPFSEHLGYDHPQGSEKLRVTISRHVDKYKKMKVDPDSVLITSGAQQAIHLIVQCLLKPGDTVAIEDPSYAYSLPVFQSAGLRTLLLPVDEYGANPDDIIELQKKHRIRMLFLNPDYQNPTGTKMSLERKKRMLELSSEYGIPIVEDDPYSLTSYHGDIGPTLKSLDDNGNVLYISSLSKVLASGMRIGWIIGPKKVIERLSDGKQQIDFGHSVFPQWVANEFLSSSSFDAHLVQLRSELMDRRNVLLSMLKRVTHQEKLFVPQGGIHFWYDVGVEVDDYQLLESAMKHGVSFVPGTLLGSKQGFVRFTYGRGDRRSIEAGITRFLHVLNQYQE